MLTNIPEDGFIPPDDAYTYTDVTIRVKERRMLRAKVQTYVESKGSEGGVETGVTLNNGLGLAEQLNATFSYGSKSSGAATLQATKPRFQGLPIRLGVVTGYSTSTRAIQSSYDEKIRKVECSVKHMDGGHELTAGTNWRDILPVRNPDNLYEYAASGLILSQAKPSLKNSITYSYTYDKRNHMFGPSKGSYLRASTEVAAFGGDVQFSKSQLKVQQFWPILENILPGSSIGASFQAGFLMPFSTKEVTEVGSSSSICDRFWLGGPLEFRGFSFKGAGPRTSPNKPGAKGGDSLGGDVTWSVGYSVSLPFPHPVLHDAGMRTQLFMNAGNLCAYETSFRSLILGSRVSCGVGVVFPLAFGRLEANYSHILRANSRDQEKRFQLGFGLDFM